LNPSTFLSELRRRDIHVWIDGEQLRCNARAGALTPDVRDQLRLLRGDIERFLRSAQAVAVQQPAIVPLQPKGDRVPVFAVPGHNGDVFCYRALAQALGESQPFFGLQPPGLDDSEPLDRVADLAEYLAQQVRAFRPSGPYIIAGFCAGGTVAFELARRLSAGGESRLLLALFGAPFPTFFRKPQQLRYRLVHRSQRWRNHVRMLAHISWRARIDYFAERLRRKSPPASDLAADPVLALRARLEAVTLAAVRAYDPGHFDGHVHLFMPCNSWPRSPSGFAGWRWQTVARHAEPHFGPDGCTTDDMLLAPHVSVFAELFRNSCDWTIEERH
jgi:thioesterase domain-containing protein